MNCSPTENSASGVSVDLVAADALYASLSDNGCRLSGSPRMMFVPVTMTPPGPDPVGVRTGVILNTDDIDATHARLTASGIDVSEVRTGRKPGTRVMTVRNGTCGVPTLLVQLSGKPE